MREIKCEIQIENVNFTIHSPLKNFTTEQRIRLAHMIYR